MWVYDREAESIYSNDGENSYIPICIVGRNNDANAELIRRAPELLAALEAIKSALNTEENGEALIEVARNAHRAEQELAALARPILSSLSLNTD